MVLAPGEAQGKQLVMGRLISALTNGSGLRPAPAQSPEPARLAVPIPWHLRLPPLCPAL